MPPTPTRRALPSRPAAPAARPAPGRAAPSRAAQSQPIASGYRGADGLRKMEEEEQRAAARREANNVMNGAPFRFYTPAGETREVIVVDAEPDYFRKEHVLQGHDRKWNVFAPCVEDHANCPICASGPEKPAYFAMYLTVIDLTPFTTRAGEYVEWSRKLMVVKPSMQKKFMRLLERHGTLRGMHLSMSRDGEKDAAIGDPEFIGHISEEDLETYVSSYEDGKGAVVEVYGSEVFDYDAIFPPMTEEELAALVGGATHSYDAANRSIGRGGEQGDWGNRQAPAPRTAARPAARPAPTASRPAARPAPRREEEPAGEPVEGEESPFVEDTPPARPASRLPVPASRPAPRGAAPAPRQAPRSAPVEDDPPQRPAPNLAARRQALRGGR